MTHSGVPKPQYYALKMLNDLAENRLDLGDGATDQEDWVRLFSNGRIQILLFRQKMKNLDFKEKATICVELNKGAQCIMNKIDEEQRNH